MLHYCRTFSFSGVHVLYLKSINDQTAFAALGICSQHYFFPAYVFWNWIQILCFQHLKQGKVCENIFLYNVYNIFKEIILPFFFFSYPGLKPEQQNRTGNIVEFFWGFNQNDAKENVHSTLLALYFQYADKHN